MTNPNFSQPNSELAKTHPDAQHLAGKTDLVVVRSDQTVEHNWGLSIKPPERLRVGEDETGSIIYEDYVHVYRPDGDRIIEKLVPVNSLLAWQEPKETEAAETEEEPEFTILNPDDEDIDPEEYDEPTQVPAKRSYTFDQSKIVVEEPQQEAQSEPQVEKPSVVERGRAVLSDKEKLKATLKGEKGADTELRALLINMLQSKKNAAIGEVVKTEWDVRIAPLISEPIIEAAGVLVPRIDAVAQAIQDISLQASVLDTDIINGVADPSQLGPRLQNLRTQMDTVFTDSERLIHDDLYADGPSLGNLVDSLDASAFDVYKEKAQRERQKLLDLDSDEVVDGLMADAEQFNGDIEAMFNHYAELSNSAAAYRMHESTMEALSFLKANIHTDATDIRRYIRSMAESIDQILKDYAQTSTLNTVQDLRIVADQGNYATQMLRENAEKLRKIS